MASLSKAYAFSWWCWWGGEEGAEKGEMCVWRGEIFALAARWAVVCTCSEPWWWSSQKLVLGRVAQSMCGVHRRGRENWVFSALGEGWVEMPCCCLQQLLGECREGGGRLFSREHSDRMRGNEQSCNMGNWVDIRIIPTPLRAAKLWNKLPRGGSISILGNPQNVTRAGCSGPCPVGPAWSRDWTRWLPEILSNLYYSVNILGLTGLVHFSAGVLTFWKISPGDTGSSWLPSGAFNDRAGSEEVVSWSSAWLLICTVLGHLDPHAVGFVCL